MATFMAVLWSLWRQRNEVIFRDSKLPTRVVANRAEEDAKMWLKFCTNRRVLVSGGDPSRVHALLPPNTSNCVQPWTEQYEVWKTEYEQWEDYYFRPIIVMTKVSSDHPSTEEALQIMKKTMSKETKRLEEKLAKKSTELEKLIKRHNEVLKENKVLRDTQHDMAIEVEKLHQQIEELTSMNYDEANLMKFSYLDLKEATCNFNENLEIGKGGYGRVYKAVLHCTIVAIKVLHSGGNQGEKEFYQEVEILKNVRHPNIVTLIGGCLQNWALVYEFIPNGSLENYISSLGGRKSLSWKIQIQIASNICSALIFLHSTKPHGIAHGDLKPENILLDSNYQAKLSDFGISRLLMKADNTVTPHHLTEYPKGTLAYIDPEYLQTGEMNPQCDVYSFGIILLQLVTGKSALGISKSVQEALQSHRFKKELDASAKWPFEKAIKMAELSLRCCDPTRKNRPNLASEVWCAIESMKTDASS
ncbi:U-box domain-containing protein 33-like [Carex rostrata]